VFHPGILNSIVKCDMFLHVDEFLRTVKLRKGSNIALDFPLDGTPKKYVPLVRAFTSGTATCTSRSYSAISLASNVPEVHEYKCDLCVSDCRTRLRVDVSLVALAGEDKHFSLEFKRCSRRTDIFGSSSPLVLPKPQSRKSAKLDDNSLRTHEQTSSDSRTDHVVSDISGTQPSSSLCDSSSDIHRLPNMPHLATVHSTRSTEPSMLKRAIAQYITQYWCCGQMDEATTPFEKHARCRVKRRVSNTPYDRMHL